MARGEERDPVKIPERKDERPNIFHFPLLTFNRCFINHWSAEWFQLLSVECGRLSLYPTSQRYLLRMSKVSVASRLEIVLKKTPQLWCWHGDWFPYLVLLSSSRQHGSPCLLFYLGNHTKSVSLQLCSSFGGNQVPAGKKMFFRLSSWNHRSW